jgi:2TM domain
VVSLTQIISRLDAKTECALDPAQCAAAIRGMKLNKKHSRTKRGSALDEQLKYRRARERMAEIKGFYIHALVFVLVVSGLAAVNFALGKPYWVLWVLLGWGAGVALHAALVFGRETSFLSNWEARKMKQLMNEVETPSAGREATEKPMARNGRTTVVPE